MTTDDLLALLVRMRANLERQPSPAHNVRTIIKPRKEVSDAVLRWRGIVSYYAPDTHDMKLTALYEYAALRLLRESIVSPELIAADLSMYVEKYDCWWERWRTR